jgi:hypothetical protein
MNERKNNWMDGWARYFSTLCWATSSLIKPLRWGTSSLSYFSEQPLVWATCALSCLPQLALFVASATQFFSSCRCHTAFRSPQLQSRFARAAVSLGLWQPVANPHGIAERPHQIDHHPRGHYSAGLLGRSSPATGEAEKTQGFVPELHFPTSSGNYSFSKWPLIWTASLLRYLCFFTSLLLF